MACHNLNQDFFLYLFGNLLFCFSQNKIFDILCSFSSYFGKLVNVWCMLHYIPIMYIFVHSFESFGVRSILLFSGFSFQQRFSTLFWSFEFSLLIHQAFLELRVDTFNLRSISLVKLSLRVFLIMWWKIKCNMLIAFLMFEHVRSFGFLFLSMVTSRRMYVQKTVDLFSTIFFLIALWKFKLAVPIMSLLIILEL